MTPKEIVQAAIVPGTKSVYVLGCFEKRVTVYSQQIRALNLVDGILSEATLRPNGKVAIVGGGVAGMTAAVALAKACPNLQQLDLFESRPRVLEFQHGSSRFLHPHFYDWPSSRSKEVDAGLPIMNWQAGTAGEVANVLRAEFERTTQNSRLKPYLGNSVVGLKPNTNGLVRVVTSDGIAIDRIYEAVILAIGFGIERCLDGETPSYWTPSALAGAIFTTVKDPIIFISGNGDGGLVDFQMAAFNALEHRQICDLIASLDLGPALAILNEIEQEAWEGGADVDLFKEYQDRVKPLVPQRAWAEINECLRKKVRIWLHTNEPQLFRKTTALHNRIATFLAIEAHRAFEIDAVTLKIGVNFVGPPPTRGDIALVGHTPFHPFRRFLRIGPDAANNLLPFSGLLAGFSNAAAVPSRPESPILTATARARFELLKSTAAPSIAVEGTITQNIRSSPKISVFISLSVDGRIIWTGDVAPDNFDQIWSRGNSIAVYCDISPANHARLMPAIARIGAHSEDFVLYVRDTALWQAGLATLCSDRSLPGPDLNFSCPIKDWQSPPNGLPVHIEKSIDEVLENIHTQLDNALLQRLHDSIFDILGPAKIATGWLIEVILQGTLWTLWVQWHAALTADSHMRQRFLRLLANIDDQIDATDDGLVRLGPKIIRPYLTKPTLFGLAFAACSGQTMRPADRHPGNLALEHTTAHACGVVWVNQRELRGRTAAVQSWTTNVVLLSQLQEAVQLLERDQRLDQTDSDLAKIGLISLVDQPMVIGADENFLIALQSGGHATHLFFQTIFDRRAAASQQTLEKV